ncbi:MAG: hypothetical protein SGJ02_00320 [bacterium]|nr:hypothetical protein [bacterium]
MKARKSQARIPRVDAMTYLANRDSQMSDSGAGLTKIDLERYMLTNDLLPINYFECETLRNRSGHRIIAIRYASSCEPAKR